MAKQSRRRILVDPQLQGALVLRVLGYWLLVVALMGGLAAAQVLLGSESASWSVMANRFLIAFGPSLIAALVVLPLLALDALRFSLRFAGPMGRLRREAQRLAQGTWSGPLRFRQGDFWHDLADDINRIAERLEALESKAEAAEQHADAAPV